MHAPVKDTKIKKSSRLRHFRIFSVPLSFVRRQALVIVTVIVPTVLSAIYFGLIASDIYTSQSCFAIQSPHLQNGGAAGSFFVSSLMGSSESTANANTVQNFILSRDALQELNQQFDLTSAWSDKKIDFLRRFGLFGLRKGFEYLYVYYGNMVNVQVDSGANEITLSVYGFTADQAYQINQSLLQASQRLVNQLNKQMQQDLISYALDEVDRAKNEVARTTLAISDYRNEKAVVDPVQQANLNFGLIQGLQSDLIATKTELANLRAFAPDSPVPATLELKIKTLQTEIDAETSKVTGSKNSLTSKDARYEQLQLDQAFAAQLQTAALTTLQSARDNAMQQQLYLELIAQPSRPDVAMDPKRIEGVLVTFIIGLVVWGIASMLIAGIREHQL